MIIEEEDSDDDVEIDDEELDDMDRLATEVYTEGKQPSDEDMPYVDEEDRRYGRVFYLKRTYLTYTYLICNLLVGMLIYR